MTQPLRIMCWNIAEGNLNRALPANGALPRIAAQINAKAPDIVLLNEVHNTRGWPLGSGVNQVVELSKMTGMAYHHWGNTVATGWTGHKAVAILSRYPLGLVKIHPVKRGSVITAYATLETTVRINAIVHHIFSTRFDAHDTTDRTAGIQQTIDLLHNLDADVVIFGGDFNAPPNSPEMLNFIANSGLSDVYLEHPDPEVCADETNQRIDYIFYRGPYQVNVMQHRCAWTSVDEPSDHGWVYVEFLFQPSPSVACATTPNSDVHLLMLNQSNGLRHTIRIADGTWPYPWGDVQQAIRDQNHSDVEPTKFVACAAVPNGDLHLFILDQGDGLWHTIRSADGTWPHPWGDVQQAIRDQNYPDVGPTKFVACAAAPNGDLHLCVLDQKNGLWHTIRLADGTWPHPWGDVQQAIRDQNYPDVGPTKFVECAVAPNGDLHLFALDRNNGLWHTIRSADGTWPYPWGDVQQAIRYQNHPDVGPTKFAACATAPNGDLHLFVLDRNDGLWHTIRSADGTWPYPWGDVQHVIP